MKLGCKLASLPGRTAELLDAEDAEEQRTQRSAAGARAFSLNEPGRTFLWDCRSGRYGSIPSGSPTKNQARGATGCSRSCSSLRPLLLRVLCVG